MRTIGQYTFVQIRSTSFAEASVFSDCTSNKCEPAQASRGGVLETLPGKAQTPVATLAQHSWGPGLLS